MPVFDLFETREAGTVSIVRFMQQIDDFSHRTTDLFEQLSRFVGDHECLKLVIDLRNTTYLPSSVLGVLVQLHNQGCEVHLANASDDVAEVMRVTQLNRLIHVNEVEVGPWDKVAGAELLRVPLVGYGLTCPECLHETLVDKHLLGKRATCTHCNESFSVTADAIREAEQIFATCPECHTQIRTQRGDLNVGMSCPQCDALIEIRVIV
ncbi:MAG: STAS domain-containing protein [Rhodopirellula sp.]|nr:STAS domain-containing protein [Rhodopirellula sp.]